VEKCSAQDFDALIKAADAWAKLKGYSTFFPNPSIDQSSQSRMKWEAGVKALRPRDIATGIQFAWHGTPSRQGLIGISASSWEPSRRSAQAYGPGEYFSLSDATSKGYTGSDGFLIVCALLKTAPYSSKNPHLVVNNPTRGETMYCFPCGVVLQSHQVAKVGNPFAAA